MVPAWPFKLACAIVPVRWLCGLAACGARLVVLCAVVVAMYDVATAWTCMLQVNEYGAGFVMGVAVLPGALFDRKWIWQGLGSHMLLGYGTMWLGSSVAWHGQLVMVTHATVVFVCATMVMCGCIVVVTLLASALHAMVIGLCGPRWAHACQVGVRFAGAFVISAVAIVVLVYGRVYGERRNFLLSVAFLKRC